jgi:hypothetical protein
MRLLPALLRQQHGVARMSRIGDRNHQDECTEREWL